MMPCGLSPGTINGQNTHNLLLKKIAHQISFYVLFTLKNVYN